MAERRMFAKTIVDSDAFLDMPQSAQLLYFHLGMKADDDGFVNKPKAIMRDTGCKDDDLRILASKKFIIPFESGVIVIKHWKIHNYIAKDRYNETKYKTEKELLLLDENQSYTLCTQPVYSSSTQVRIGKDREDKNKYSDDFETLWTQYPKKTDKANAVRAFNARMREGVELSLLANCLRAYLGDIKKNRTEPKYVMALTRFLGGRYTEYMSKPEKEIVCTPIDPEMMALVRKANGDKQEDICATL